MPPGNTIKRNEKKKRNKMPPLSYIVPASGPDNWITPDDLAVARDLRDKEQYIHGSGEAVTINGFSTSADTERRDRNMAQQLMAYLARPTVTPADKSGSCSPFAHTSNLTPTATVDRLCMSFRAPHLNFDASKFLKQVMSEDAKHKGFFAPFAAKHVNKVLRIVPNMKVLNKNGVAGHYHVEMCILTGMGILVARGFLYIPREQMDAVEVMHVGAVKFTQSHINWHTWGFDAERCWAAPWKTSCIGHPFS